MLNLICMCKNRSSTQYHAALLLTDRRLPKNSYLTLLYYFRFQVRLSRGVHLSADQLCGHHHLAAGRGGRPQPRLRHPQLAHLGLGLGGGLGVLRGGGVKLQPPVRQLHHRQHPQLHLELDPGVPAAPLPAAHLPVLSATNQHCHNRLSFIRSTNIYR